MTPTLSPEEAALAPPMLLDMRYVWRHPEPENKELDEFDKRIVDFRESRKKDPKHFMDLMGDLEKQFLQAKTRHQEAKAEQAKQARMEKESLARLQKNVPSEKWDGVGPCPICGGREAKVEKEASTTALIGKVETWMKKREEAK